ELSSRSSSRYVALQRQLDGGEAKNSRKAASSANESQKTSPMIAKKYRPGSACFMCLIYWARFMRGKTEPDRSTPNRPAARAARRLASSELPGSVGVSGTSGTPLKLERGNICE